MNRLKIGHQIKKTIGLYIVLANGFTTIPQSILFAQNPSTAAGAPSNTPPPAAPTRITKANYELAARWTADKVGKLVFDTSVNPHWIETGDRFWYSYETSQGRHFYLVDPLKKAKTTRLR